MAIQVEVWGDYACFIEAVVQAGFPCMVRQSKTVSQAVVELQVDAVRGIGVISMNQDFSGQFVADIRGKVL